MREFFNVIAEGAMKLISSVQWNDILDVALVAIVLYYAIKLIRQTRAFQLIKGIVFLGIIYFAVSALNMSASSYLFSQLFGDIVLVAILLFQPEIRHAIETVGRGGFSKLTGFFSKNDDFETEELKASASAVAKAASNMSDKRIGALIVLEGTTMLGEIIGTGSQVNANITSPMIENIFFPKAPLHDGAMIIRDNRIHSAGCILPLTQNEVSLELGTRHRAALGMSEHSDALIVVVSEETGAISVAHNGTLERNITVGELLEAVNAFLVSDETEKTKPFKIRRRKK